MNSHHRHLLALLSCIILVSYNQALPSKSLSITTSRIPAGNEEKVFRPETHRRQVYNLPFPECATKSQGRAQTFLMVFMGHSGSSAIMSELYQHPEVLIENPEAVDHPPYQFNTDLSLKFTEEFFQRGIAQNKTAGFKIRPWHIVNASEKWQQLIKKYNTRIIWQYRENNLKQTVGEYSYIVLNDSNILEGLRTEYQVKNRCKIGIGCNFEIHDFDQFHKMLKQSLFTYSQILKATELADNNRKCILQVKYEDYLYYRKGTMLDVFEFLGIDQSFESNPNRFKATGDNMCEVVTNWKELCRNFYGCARWRHYFEDEVNGCSCPFSNSPNQYCDASLY